MKNLEELKNIDIQTADMDSLVDINDVVIDPNLSKEEKIAAYIRQIKNPYCFLCDGIVVKMSFAEEGETLEEKLYQYCHSLDSEWSED